MCEIDLNRKPLIHCITNPIAMNQSANAVLECRVVKKIEMW